ncbi:hypothetical protein VF14_05705 [Nostoc linckia z18]|jgi:hypothetical protein|uniref:Uncharacterized protein n=2 Tax=Nostoc linckia TaxID=92942 RepID=A0A9Q5ZE89_NOSLI|nr:hypothetical protein [Nostoc linckia]PHK27481.1 hypothetical protein VF12_34840 [Nostoc linckia z15]PHK47738.1 hypothetical protein VF13_03565 [Nostoc linckia z16]PHJ65956.1 hypothetical protein VF02_08910 [Nostoc linckia z1]PHJ68863.1 hypothetical protein VF05_14545 [Nostoc linckia z3]PHJ74514.1 hypothetical protein VF03_13370 [Nostoc linckia z2]
MLDVPNPVITYLLNFFTAERSLAYLLVNKDGSLLDWGGKLAKYGIINLTKGENITEQVYFLEGLLPLNETSLFLPFLKTEYGSCADVHMFSTQEGDWILLLDSSCDENQLFATQQKGNEYNLLQEKLNK